MLRLFVAAALLLCTASCKRTSSTSSSTPLPQPTARAVRQGQKIEPCSLITKEEVGAVQATNISDTKSNEGSDGSYLISQCYYAATGPNLSVSLAVTQVDPQSQNGRSPREQWGQTFGRFENGAEQKETEEKEAEEKKKQKGREEEENLRPPKKIEGVGEEAFWAGNRVGGAFYVLKGDVFIRISVGGPDNEEKKIEKSKTLAQKALGRLP